MQGWGRDGADFCSCSARPNLRTRGDGNPTSQMYVTKVFTFTRIKDDCPDAKAKAKVWSVGLDWLLKSICRVLPGLKSRLAILASLNSHTDDQRPRLRTSRVRNQGSQAFEQERLQTDSRNKGERLKILMRIRQLKEARLRSFRFPGSRMQSQDRRGSGIAWQD